ncbi:MAG: PEP-utilizing protein [Sulfobacillus benefaciens]|uniref:PEP-utilizing protein n=1 Tax=Sulfobacillus benefaciens TaxID=453960 RepID=A0A2T2XCM7_9FIRM|nr:MAG: PEP-utilizing protein [Sulfobacillus benefaciens]
MTMMEALTLTEKDVAEHFWAQDALHFGHPITPLFASYMIPAITIGTLRAMSTLHAPIKQFIGKVHDGYFYQAVVPAPGDPQEIVADHQKTLESLMVSQDKKFQATVTDIILPLYHEIDAMVRQDLTPDSAIAGLKRLQEIYYQLWELHFVIVLPRGAVANLLEEIYHQAFPQQDPTTVYTLVLGVMNKSLETDRALWQLAQNAKKNSEVVDCFTAPDILSCLKANAQAEVFLHQLDEFLEQYGWRSVHSHEFSEPTWREDPTHALSVIKSHLDNPFDFDAHLHEVAQTRNIQVQEVVKNIQDPHLQDQFMRVHSMALNAWGIDEDHHFYIDAMLPAKARPFLLKVGALMKAQHQLSSPDDIFFIYLDEVFQALEGVLSPEELMDQVIARRKDYVRQKSIKPQPSFGTPPTTEHHDPMMTRVFGEGAPSIEGTAKRVRGFSASPGRYNGRARIIHSPNDFVKVRPGEILVCRTTTPAWTALFGVVGAVVTDTGGILSHAATVAREYGIPCVVGTRHATRLFADGDQLLVDGSEGIVTVDG